MDGHYCPKCGQHKIASWVKLCESCSRTSKKNITTFTGILFWILSGLSIYWYFKQYILPLMPRKLNLLKIYDVMNYHYNQLDFSTPSAYILPALLLGSLILVFILNQLLFRLFGVK